MKMIFFALLAGLATPVVAQSQSMAAAVQPAAGFTLAPLPYDHAALDPVIDAETMRIHHGRHHQAYVDALNKAVAADPALAGQSLSQLLAKAGSLSPIIRNNAGGHWNHSFFWQSMTAPAQSGQPSALLAQAINRQWGSLDRMKVAFKQAGTGQFGSGWVWLSVDSQGQLLISATPNQDNPLMDVVSVRAMPILGNDVWEHAYYLKYQNKRGDYLDNWWRVVDWNIVSKRYQEALAKR
jgi:superoxide dismutase, Fe-Mn family